jgi:uncharacterized lipoprotein YehR (DUF1307 family)
MKHALHLLFAVVLTVSIAACGKSHDTAKPVAPPKETVFDDLVATKARAKQQTDQAAELNKQKHDAAMKQIEDPGAAQ